MGMLERLRTTHPDTVITAFDGHHARIGDADMHVVSHIEVARGAAITTFRAVEQGRRKQPSPKAIEERFDRLIAGFELRSA
jgi:hypothetical protein